jgi:hypothetical protein
MGIPGARIIDDRMGAVPASRVARYLIFARLVTVTAIVTSPLWLAALFFTGPEVYSASSSLICVPLLIIVGMVGVAYFTQREPYLRRLMLAGLVAHMAASAVFIWVGFVIYEGTSDAFHYWTIGLQEAEDFKVLGWAVFQGPYWSTNLINNICGVATLVIGDALPTLFIAFTMISLAGAYLFYRAFAIAFPNGDRWLFGLLVVLSPSLLFWASFLGKDALIQYFIALACFGFARVIQAHSPRGALLCAIGVGGTLLIRAHIAVMLAIAITFSYATGKSKARGPSKATRIVLIPVLVVGTYLLIRNAGSMINLDNENSMNVLQEANTLTRYSQVGGSSFNHGSSLPVRILESPFLLIRPFPWEMHNLMAVAPTLESMGWIWLCWLRRRQIWSTLRDWRHPYITFLLGYTAVFVITFGGAISNFGILLRQRIMVVPFVLMLICSKQKLPEWEDAGDRIKAERLTSGALRPNRIADGA